LLSFISKTESNKKADKKMYIGFAVGIIGTLLAAMLPEMLKKIPKEKEEIIQVNVSIHNAAIDTVFVQTDTIKKK
jgi:type II secretory pathway pseudopilin PulG